MTMTTIGLDLAKYVFQVHGVDAEGNVIEKRRLRRSHGRSAAATARREQGGRDRNACKENECPHGSMVDGLPQNRCSARRTFRSAPHPPGGNGPTRFQAYFRKAHETVTEGGKDWETSSPARSPLRALARRPAAPCRRAR